MFIAESILSLIFETQQQPNLKSCHKGAQKWLFLWNFKLICNILFLNRWNSSSDFQKAFFYYNSPTTGNFVYVAKIFNRFYKFLFYSCSKWNYLYNNKKCLIFSFFCIFFLIFKTFLKNLLKEGNLSQKRNYLKFLWNANFL